MGKIMISVDIIPLVAFISVIFIVAMLGVTYAYGGFSPSQMGHSSGEVMVSVGGVAKTLQQAINDGDFAGDSGGGVSIDYADCEFHDTCIDCNLNNNGLMSTCSNGYVMIGLHGGYGHSGNFNTPHRIRCCRLISA